MIDGRRRDDEDEDADDEDDDEDKDVDDGEEEEDAGVLDKVTDEGVDTLEVPSPGLLGFGG